MSLPDLLSRVNELQERITAAGPLTPEAKRKLDYRFRLDWNYHSNVMEGSSLTKQETRTIMLGNVTVEGKPIKDVLEMQGHDEVVSDLLKMASGELNLSEARIKEVHQAILHEDDPAKRSQIGQWKQDPNYLLNYRNERIDFTPPEEVPEAMHRLLDRTKAAIERIERKSKDAQHPAVLAFDFHREYVTIHPFHDGNGRTARIFSNIILMRFSFPPVVVKVGEKEAYNRLLAEVQVYGASPDLFNTFMAERLVRAQELVVDAIEGRDLEESDDLAKRAKLLFLQAEGERLTEEEHKAKQEAKVRQWIELNLEPLVARIVQKFKPFEEFFERRSYRYLIAAKDKRQFMPEMDQVRYDKVLNIWQQNQNPGQIGITLSFIGFRFAEKPKEKKMVAAIRFQPQGVQVHWYGPDQNDELAYSDDVTKAPMAAMDKAANALLEELQKLLNKPMP